MNPLQIQKDFYKEMDESIKEELQSLRGNKGYNYYGMHANQNAAKQCKRMISKKLYINNYSDEYKSGGVIGLVKRFIQVQYKITSLTGIIFQSKKICYLPIKLMESSKTINL